jgi:hypothetical protein
VKIAWKGKEYKAVAKMTGKQILLLEREIGLDSDDWSRYTSAMALAFCSVHREDPDAITWDEVVGLDQDEMYALLVEEPGDEAGDKQGKPAEGSDPLAGGSPAKSASKGSHAGRPAAGARSRTASKRTS